MRQVMLNTPHTEVKNPQHLARLSRHLRARLQDFGPGSPEITQFDMSAGVVGARFPDQDPWDVVNTLEREHNIFAVAEENDVVFYLNETVAFEDLDYVWGRLG